MSLEQSLDPKPTFWQRVWRVVWGLRFLYVVVAILGGTAWLLYPLHDASQTPAPPLPSYTPEPPDLQETLVLGPTTFAPGAQGATRVLVRDPRAGQPIPDVALRVSLAPRSRPDVGQTLYTGRTDEWGTAEVTFLVPHDARGEQALVVDADGPIGAQRVVRAITIRQDIDLYLMTDKQVYRPGETIRFWSLALGRIDGLPLVGEPVTLTLSNARGNRVCTQAATTSAYGVAHASCALADRVSHGDYRLVAALGEAVAEREVVVEPQAQADLVVEIQTGRPYYLSGERLDAVVLVTDVFGEPIAGAAVDVLGEVDGTETIAFRAQGDTDERGAFALAADLESSMGESERVLVRVAARAIDEAGRAGRHETWVPVSAQPMQITAWPESGALKPGMENLLYLRVVYADGRPATCNVEVTLTGVEGTLETETDAAGLARIGYTPTAGQPVTVTILTRDAGGQESRAVLGLAVEGGKRHLLLRPDHESYSAGDPMHVDVFVPGVGGAVYLDLRLEGQGIAAHAAPAIDGRAAFDVALPDDLAGVFELHAYALLADGTVVRDVRQVAVAPPRQITLSAVPEHARYEPGDTARVVFRVVKEGGQSVQGTFGAVVAVGEGSLSSHQGRPDLGWMGRDPVSASELSPQYAEVASRRRPMPEPVRRELDAYEAAWAVRHQVLSTVAERLVWGVLGWAALSWVVVLADGWQSRAPGRSGHVLGTLLGGAVVLSLVVVGGALLAHFCRALLGTGAILALGMGWLGALLALLVQGWTRRSGWLHLCAALTVGALTLGGGLRFALLCGAALVSPLVVAMLAALGAALLSLCAWAVGMLRRAEQSCALTTLSIAVLLVCTAAGSVLSGPDEGLPAHERLPEQVQVDAAPAPVFVQNDAPLIVPLRASDPFPLAPGRWSGRTVYWDAEARTDAHGNLALDLSLGDSPIDLRLSALVLTDEGTGGAGEAQVESYAPLSIELALPGELSVGDRLDVPVYIRNALPVSQAVQISVTQASWFRLRTWGVDVQEAEVPAQGVVELTLPIQVREWGDVALELGFEGDVQSGVVSRTVSVRPNGHLVARAYSWWIGDWVRYKFRVPWSALSGTDQIAVKLYPGRWSVLAEALEQAVQWEGNTFDQVSAAIQARLLQAAYLRRIEQWEGARRTELERTLALDYQRLLAFESPDGGFSAFGAEAVDLYRSALALRCLHELSAYYPVDPAVLDRTALWLFRQQTEDGTWQLAEMPPSWSTLPRTELPATAYVAWALVDAGYGHMDGVRSAIEHLEGYVDQSGDPYVLALIVNALVAYDAETAALDAALARLAEQAEVQNGLAFWPSQVQTLSGAAGGPLEADGYRTPSVKVEVVALATHALSRARVYPERVEQGMATLTDSRDVNGTWNAPQTTILALRAYVAALPEDEMPGEADFYASVEVTVDEVIADPAVFDGDVGQTRVFDELAKGYNDVEIAVEGDEIAYQIVGRYVLPWSQVPLPSPEEEDVSVEVSYDRTLIGVGERLTATVGVALNRPGVAPLVELGLGLPPGLSLVVGDLDDLQARGTIARYERVGGQIIVYLVDLSSEEPVRFSYGLRGMYPLAVRTQATYAVDIANPQRPAVRPPVEIEVVANR